MDGDQLEAATSISSLIDDIRFFHQNKNYYLYFFKGSLDLHLFFPTKIEKIHKIDLLRFFEKIILIIQVLSF